MFEARLKVNTGIQIPDELRAYVKAMFERGGHHVCVVQDVQEALLGDDRTDLLPAINMVRNEFGNLWLRREWWT